MHPFLPVILCLKQLELIFNPITGIGGCELELLGQVRGALGRRDETSDNAHKSFIFVLFFFHAIVTKLIAHREAEAGAGPGMWTDFIVAIVPGPAV